MTITINGTTGIAGVDGSASTPALQGTDTNTGVYFGTDLVYIATGGTAAVTVDSGQRTKFPTTIGVGGATPSTSGSGVSFPATQSASSDANTLDDYEEGTWTAVVKGDGTAGTYELQTNQSTYVKIGNFVYLNCNLRLASSITAGGTGALIITGLPFTKSASQGAFGSSYLSGVDIPASVLYVTTSFYSTNSSATLYFAGIKDDAAETSVLISGVLANDYIGFSIGYQV